MEAPNLQDTSIYHGHIQIRLDTHLTPKPMHIQHNPRIPPKDPSPSKHHKESKMKRENIPTKKKKNINNNNNNNQIKLPPMNQKIKLTSSASKPSITICQAYKECFGSVDRRVLGNQPRKIPHVRNIINPKFFFFVNHHYIHKNALFQECPFKNPSNQVKMPLTKNQQFKNAILSNK